MNDSLKIIKYQPQYRNSVVDLLGYLWGGDDSYRQEYFNWKYETHPHSEKSEGIIAIDGNRVVGFRGLFPMKWQGFGSAGFDLLALADTIVDPDCRGKGVFLNTTRALFDLYGSSSYRGIINLSSSAPPLNGYLRLGWKPIIPKTYLRSFHWFPGRLLLRWLPNRRSYGTLMNQSNQLTDSFLRTQLEISSSFSRFHVIENEKFLRWRYSRPGVNYLFFNLKHDSSQTYAIGVAPDNSKLYLLDYDSDTDQGLHDILHSICSAFPNTAISVWNTDNQRLNKIFKKSHFTTGIIANYFETHFRDASPILIRPMTEKISGGDWKWEGQDILDPKNWRIREIYSDGV